MADQAGTKFPGGCEVGCDTCAFRRDSETRSEPYNTVKAMLCELGGVPFYCHHDRDGRDFHASDKPTTVTNVIISDVCTIQLKTLDIRQMRICEGWKQAVRKRAQDPRWKKNRLVKKAIAELGLGALEGLVDNPDPAARKRNIGVLQRAIEYLNPGKTNARKGSGRLNATHVSTLGKLPESH